MAPESEWLTIQVDRTDIERFGVELPNVHTCCVPVKQHHRWKLGQHLNLAVQTLLEIDRAKAALVADVNVYLGKLYAGMLDDFCAILQGVQPQVIPDSLAYQGRPPGSAGAAVAV
jgi:hypothetical protein